MQQINTIARDNLGNVGNIPIVQGESRLITVFFFNSNGTPYVYTSTPSEILVKIFSNINQASIVKRLSASQVATLSLSGILTGISGIQFNLLATDTILMAPNNSGLGMSIAFTDNAMPGNVLELDMPEIFNISLPLIQT